MSLAAISPASQPSPLFEMATLFRRATSKARADAALLDEPAVPPGPSNPVVPGLRQSEQPLGVCRRLSDKIVERFPANGRQTFGGELDVGWLIALAAQRMRREIGAVGFDQNSVGRD